MVLGALLSLVISIARSAIALFRARENQAIVELALRQQLAVYVHRHPRPRLSPLDPSLLGLPLPPLVPLAKRSRRGRA